MPEAFESSLPIFVTLLRMVEANENIVLWGRCEGIVIGKKYHYNGFVIYRNSTIEEINAEFGRYVEFSSVHRFTDVPETEDILVQLRECAINQSE